MYWFLRNALGFVRLSPGFYLTVIIYILLGLCFSNLSISQNHLKGLVKYRMWVPFVIMLVQSKRTNKQNEALLNLEIRVTDTTKPGFICKALFGEGWWK